MDLSVIIVVSVGTLIFFGFAVWMAFYSRRKPISGETQAGQSATQTEKLTNRK